jgi:hypothetical protein
MSKKIEEGGRRVTADLGRDVILKLDQARMQYEPLGMTIHTITETLEQIIRKADVKTLWTK